MAPAASPFSAATAGRPPSAKLAMPAAQPDLAGEYSGSGERRRLPAPASTATKSVVPGDVPDAPVGRSAKLALPDPLAEFSVGRSRREFSPALGTAFLGFYAFPVPVASPVRHGALAGF